MSSHIEEEDATPVTTRGGDDGQSGLIDGSRRYKDDIAFDALGTIDEAQVAMGCCRGVLRSMSVEERLQSDIEALQYLMLTAGGVMACPINSPPVPGQPVITDDDIRRVEDHIAQWKKRVELEPRFFVAGDSVLGMEFDRARTVIRRSERMVVKVVRSQGLAEQKTVSRFLNRLSDWFFILARWADAAHDSSPV